MSRQTKPLTRADLEQLAEEYGIRIDDLWPALEAEWAGAADDDEDELIA